MDPKPPIMKTRPLIEMAITAIIKAIESTAVASTSVRKHNAINRITPGLERTHTVAQTTTVAVAPRLESRSREEMCQRTLWRARNTRTTPQTIDI